MSTSTETYADLEVGATLYRVDYHQGPIRTSEGTVEKVTARQVTIRIDGGPNLPSYSRRLERLPGLVVSDEVAPSWYRTAPAALRGHAAELEEKAMDARRRASDLLERAEKVLHEADRLEDGS